MVYGVTLFVENCPNPIVMPDWLEGASRKSCGGAAKESVISGVLPRPACEWLYAMVQHFGQMSG